MKRFWITTLNTVFAVALACSTGLCFEVKTDRGLALGGATLLTNPTAADLSATPGIWLGADYLLVSAALQRRFNIRELDNATVSVAYKTAGVVIGLSAQQMGRSEYYTEKTARLSLGYQFSEYKIAGVYSVRELGFGGGSYNPIQAGAFGVSVGMNNKRYIATLLIDNLNRPRFTEFSPEVERFIEAQIQPKSESILSASFRLRARENDRPRLALGQSLALSSEFSLLWGIENRPLQFGAGFTIGHESATITYGGRFHGELGYTQQASLTYRFGGNGKSARNGDGER